MPDPEQSGNTGHLFYAPKAISSAAAAESRVEKHNSTEVRLRTLLQQWIILKLMLYCGTLPEASRALSDSKYKAGSRL